MLNTFLVEQYADGKKVMVIVDEAQNLGQKVLEEIRLISGIETHKEKVLRIILAGQPELKDKVESPGLRQLAQRVRLRFHLGPLSKREMSEYIDHRLEVAGAPNQKIFDKDTCNLIYRFTGGVPRLTNTLCDTAMLCAFADDEHQVSREIVQNAVDELGWQQAAQPSSAPQSARRSLRNRDGRQSDPRFDQRFSPTDRTSSDCSIPAGRIIVGRTPDNDIRLDSKFVSRHHAQIVSTVTFVDPGRPQQHQRNFHRLEAGQEARAERRGRDNHRAARNDLFRYAGSRARGRKLASRLLENVFVARAFRSSVISAPQKHDHPRNQTANTDRKAQRGPERIVQIDRRPKRTQAGHNVEVRNAFVRWFRNPHRAICLLIPG